MSGTRRRVLVSYVALLILVFSAVAHAFPPLPAPVAVRTASLVSVAEIDEPADRDVLPGALLLREIQTQRPSRADSRDGDGGAIPPAIAAAITPSAPDALGAFALCTDHPASPRTSYRPRDPPATA